MSSLELLIDVALISIAMITAGITSGCGVRRQKKERTPTPRIRLF
jgi:hypothetical protein